MNQHLVLFVVEPRGVEPLSENLSTRLSTSVSYVLTFPPSGARKQAQDFSSFIDPTCGKAYAGWFPTLMTPVSDGVGTAGRTVTAYAATGTKLSSSVSV